MAWCRHISSRVPPRVYWLISLCVLTDQFQWGFRPLEGLSILNRKVPTCKRRCTYRYVALHMFLYFYVLFLLLYLFLNRRESVSDWTDIGWMWFGWMWFSWMWFDWMWMAEHAHMHYTHIQWVGHLFSFLFISFLFLATLLLFSFWTVEEGTFCWSFHKLA